MENTSENRRTWVYDKLSNYKYEEEGIAELERIYLDLPESNEDHSIVKYPIVAKGVTAFLADSSITSFKSSLKQNGFNSGVPVRAFFTKYYIHCIKILRQIDHFSTPFEDEWKSETELTRNHLEMEKTILEEPQIFYSEFHNSEKEVVEIIKKASDKYLDWVKEKIQLDTTTQSQPDDTPLSQKPKLPFFKYLLHNKPEQLANELRAKFNTEKGKGIRFMIESLEKNEPPLLTIGDRQKKEIYDSLKLFFGRDIGTYNGIFQCEINKTYSSGFSSASRKLDFILKSID
jgi:hypothetical protein